MSTVNNIPGGTGADGAPAAGNAGKIAVKASVNLNHGGEAFQQLNERIGNNSQTSPINRADNAVHHAQDAGASVTDGNNGNHYGQLKHGKGQAPTTVNTPPIIVPPTPTQTGKPGMESPPFNPHPNTPNGQTKGQPTNTPPIIQFPNTNHIPTRPTNYPQNQTPNWNPTILIFNTRIFSSNAPNGVLRNAVVDILRQNDIYISRSIINNLVGNQNSNGNNGNNRAANIPIEIRNLVQSVVTQLTNTLNNSSPPSPQFIRQTAAEISNNLPTQLNSARDILLYAARPDAKNFSSLNIQERVFLSVELMFRHLPTDTNLQQVSTREVYNGLMLARGLVASNENTAEIRNLIAFRSDALPNNFSVTGLRDLGQLVKVLIADAGIAKTTANLDLAVQKFVRLLLANNELGVLLAASALGKQAEIGTISMNRTMALVQIYQLISRLILAGEAAMKEAAAKNGLAKNENNFAANGLNKIIDADEKMALLRDLQNTNLHSNLKNFLEFNPAFVTERSASSFVASEDARHAQQHFSDNHHDEIEQWLNSGNHRFVKEIDLDKPVGIVVERGAEDFFTASKARIVLVRDSSEQGWHFLKSFLVK